MYSELVNVPFSMPLEAACRKQHKKHPLLGMSWTFCIKYKFDIFMYISRSNNVLMQTIEILCLK